LRVARRTTLKTQWLLFLQEQIKGIIIRHKQYTSLLAGLQAVGQVKGWKVQQIVFVGRTCGSVHVESFNKNMKALGVLESQWDPIRKKLVRRLLEEQDKVLRSYFAQKGGARSQGGEGIYGRVGNMSSGTCMREEEANSARGPELDDQIVIKRRTGELGVAPNFCLDFVQVIKLSSIELS
jgi:hypothetical protein